MSGSEQNDGGGKTVIGHRCIRNRETGEIVTELTPIFAEDWPYGFVHPNQPLLRYMDFWKFQDLIESGELYFCRADKFADPLEGTISKPGVHGTSASDLAFFSKVPVSREDHAKLAEYREIARSSTFINCWHMNTEESPRMWADYTTSSDSVLVITTAENLVNALKRKVMMSPVKYVDENTARTEFGIHSLFLYKDEAFAHEREFRLLIAPLMDGETVLRDDPDDFFRKVPVDISCLVDKIQIHPQASPETYERVKSVVRRHLPGAQENTGSQLFDLARAAQEKLFERTRDLNRQIRFTQNGSDSSANESSDGDPSESLSTIEKLLIEGGNPPGSARRRADILLSEITRLRLPVTFLMPRPVRIGWFPDGSEMFADLVEYRVGDTGFSVERADCRKITAETTSGTSFDQGILTYLSRVLEHSKNLLPETIRNRKWYRESLSDPRNHLNALNEIWWLRWWKKAQGIEANVCLHQGSKVDVDWRFEIGNSDITVNLEVKRRPSDVRRLDPDSGIGAKSLFEEGLQSGAKVPKFTPSPEGTVNVLAITIYCPLNQELEAAANEFVDDNDLNVDAVAIWSWTGPPHFSLCTGASGSKGDLLRDHLLPSDEEDEQEIHLLCHPLMFEGGFGSGG